jgi:hypothetical protein
MGYSLASIVILNKKLSVNAGKSLVKHFGWDSEATNCNKGAVYQDKLYMDKIPVNQISPIIENRVVKKSMKRMFWWRNTKLIKWWALINYELRITND